MIAAAAGIRVLVATQPVDFRKGADGLVALVRERLGHDPFAGTIFVFRSKRADRLKILAWDGSGLVLFWKRLEHGAFRWPPVIDGVMRLTPAQLDALVDGMDWSRLHARRCAADGNVVRLRRIESGCWCRVPNWVRICFSAARERDRRSASRGYRNAACAGHGGACGA